MREAAQAEFDKGCDQPAVTLTVEFIDVTQTEEYRQYSFLQSIFLGDAVHVIAKSVGVEVSMRMTAYTYNCLTRQYEKMTLVYDGGLFTAYVDRVIVSGTKGNAELEFILRDGTSHTVKVSQLRG